MELPTLSTSVPNYLDMSELGPTSVVMSWTKPQQTATGVVIDQYDWSVLQGGVEVDKCGSQCNGELSVKLEKLKPSESYVFMIKATSSKKQVMHFCTCQGLKVCLTHPRFGPGFTSRSLKLMESSMF